MVSQPEQDVRACLLAVALDLFARKGFSETSVLEIVSASGVSKGAFYHYFHSKDEVLEELHNEFLDQELTMAEASNQRGGSSTDRLRQFVHDLVGSILLYRKNVAVFFQEIDRLSPERRRQIESKRRVYQDYLERIVRDGIASGEFRRSLDPTIATLGIFGLVNYTYRWLREDGRLSTQEVTRMLADMVIGSVVAASQPSVLG